MASFNKVILMGNLTRNPEVRYTPGGAAVCEVRLALNHRYVTSDGQERDETCFVDISVWGKQGEACGRYLQKGAPLFVEGRLKLDQWDDRETGKKVSKMRVVADRTQFIGAPRGSAEQAYDQSQAQPQQQGGYQPQPQQPQQPAQRPYQGQGGYQQQAPRAAYQPPAAAAPAYAPPPQDYQPRQPSAPRQAGPPPAQPAYQEPPAMPAPEVFDNVEGADDDIPF